MRPEEVDQQRVKEAKALRRFIGSSLLASLLLHGSLLAWQSNRRLSSETPKPTEVVVVPKRPDSPPPIPAKPTEPAVSEPLPRPSPDLAAVPQVPESSAAVQQSPTANLPEATGQLEGRPDVSAHESPLVGSGLSAGEGGFSEGIGLNRSDSPIRGSGGGARQGVPGGDPGVAPVAPASPSPVVPPSPAPEPPSEESRRWVVCRRCPSPNYPQNALQTEAEGRVRVTVDLDRRGRITGVRLADSSGDAALDRVVLRTVREEWRFETVAGGATNVPIEVYMTVNGSQLNQQAVRWGNQTVVELPTAGFAPDTAPDTAPDPALEITEVTPSTTPDPAPDTAPDPAPESTSNTAASSASDPAIPQPAAPPAVESMPTPALNLEAATEAEAEPEPQIKPEPVRIETTPTASDLLIPQIEDLEPAEPALAPSEIRKPE